MKIKILHICVADSEGGAAIASNRLSKLMNEDELISSKMLVLTKNTSDENIFQIKSLLRFISRTKNYLNNLFNDFKKSYGLISFSFLGNDLSSNYLVKKADVIYIHWINNGFISLNGLEKIISLRKPIFLYCHDMWNFTGGCHQSNGCDNYKINCTNCHYFNNRLFRKLINNEFLKKKKLYSKSKNLQLILPSTDFYKKALVSNIIEKNQIHKIPNFIDIEKFQTKEIAREDNKIRILFGAMGVKSNPYKGWDDFIYFANIINLKYGHEVEFSIFGYNFNKTETEEIKFDFKNFGIINDEKKLISMYQDSDIFVFPSNQESFGQTLIESMSCGLIPISYNVGIASDVIINKKNGFIVDVGDKFGLVKSFDLIRKMELKKLKSESRNQIVKLFSKNKILSSHLELINKSKFFKNNFDV